MANSPRPLNTDEWLERHGGRAAFSESDLGRSGESSQRPQPGYKRFRRRYTMKRMLRRQMKVPPPD